MATVQVPDPEHPVCTSSSTAEPSATESSDSLCLGALAVGFWGPVSFRASGFLAL